MPKRNKQYVALEAKVTNFIGHSRSGCVKCNATAGSVSPNGTTRDAFQFLWMSAKRLFCCIGLPRKRSKQSRLEIRHRLFARHYHPEPRSIFRRLRMPHNPAYRASVGEHFIIIDQLFAAEG